MSVGQFEELLQTVAPHLTRQATNFREPIDPEQRLAVCLRFLSTGDSFTTIAASFRLGISTVSTIVKETCDVLWETLKDTYMPVPNEELWKTTALRFSEKWNIPNCIGALDGKHIVIQAPANSGSQFFNYKGTFSVVLLALVDADYRFLVVDVGASGSNSDGGIFSNSLMGQALNTGSLNVPEPSHLPSAPELGALPCVIVADEAFPLKTFLLRPYPGRRLPDDQRVFNYRLSRARRVVENAFGILSQCWRVYQRRLQVAPETADSIVKATCILHNFLRRANGNHGAEPDTSDSAEGSELGDIRGLRGNRASAEALRVRDTFRRYFNSPAGQVPWQVPHVNRGLPQ
ncbi:hypothetical protein R3I93_006733 [Phoxinus phoxinus]|uniref:DDE Tnp4 domain-containing protein n=1 Tax=Phoxinus phoxinus TaxID=58324 RepID=A0AAN9H7J1_9TELE